MPIQVFIGSSSEAQEAMEEVAEWIESAGHTPRPWTDHTLFPLGATTFESLHSVAQRVDAALFIFGEDDTVWYRDDKLKSPRDNVLLEYGLFSGALGERSVAIATIGRPKLATDLLGITYLSLSARASAKNKLRIWLAEVSAGNGIEPAISRIRSPFQSAGKRSLFEQGTTLIRRARRRVALVAKTPIPVVGTRPYGQLAHAIQYERTQFEEYISLARAASNGAIPEFLCVGSIPALVDELRSAPGLGSTFLPNLKELDQWSRRGGSKFQLRWSEMPAPTTFVVADDFFLLWFKDGSGENVWITGESDVIARALWDQVTSLSRALPASEIEARLRVSTP